MRTRAVMLLLLVATILVTMGCGAREKVREKVVDVAKGPTEKVVEEAETKIAEGEKEKEEEPAITPTSARADPTAAKAPPPTEPPAPPKAESERPSTPVPDTFEPAETLESYRLHMKMKTVIVGGTTTEFEHWLDFVREPPARHVLTKIIAEIGAEEQVVESIQIGDAVYTNVTGEEWLAVTGTSGMTGAGELLTLARGYQFSKISDCKDSGKERVNGMETSRYHCDETAEQWRSSTLGPEIVEGQMDAWLSTEYGIVIKAVSDYKIKAGDEVQELHMTMEYTDINKPIKIEAPEGVERPGLPDDISLIEGASNITAMTPLVTFQVDKPPNDVADYYASAMKENGWALDQSASMPPAMMSYKKGQRTAQILVAEEGSGAGVTIVVSEE